MLNFLPQAASTKPKQRACKTPGLFKLNIQPSTFNPSKMLNLQQIFSVTLTLFAVIDIIGSIPIIIQIRQREGQIKAELATFVAGCLMVAFLFLGQSILRLFGVDNESFALAGAVIIFLIGLEMILGIELFKSNLMASTGSIVPLAY